MDTILIKNLRIPTFIGCHAWEQELRQCLQLDMDLGLASELSARASSSDEPMVNYETVVNAVYEEVHASKYSTLEALAEHIANFVLEKFEVSQIKLSACKPYIMQPIVGVSIERSR